MKTIQLCTITAILVILLFVPACGNGDSPEEQISRFVKAGEEASENRDIGEIKKLISDQYSDENGRTKREITAVAARYFFTNKNIHIFTRTGELTFPEEKKAHLQLFVAMTAQNVSDLDALLNMQAELYRFDMVLAQYDKEWKLISAQWRRARSEDFF